MKSFLIVFLSVFFFSPGTVEARSLESVGMCQLKVKSRFAKEMEEIERERNPEMVKVLTQDANVRRMQDLERCQAKAIVKKPEPSIEMGKKPNRILNRKPAKVPSEDSEFRDWSCSEDADCLEGKLEAMGAY